jgi:hypothetical protein
MTGACSAALSSRLAAIAKTMRDATFRRCAVLLPERACIALIAVAAVRIPYPHTYDRTVHKARS